ncbi:GNAT family N-acetyltransferase [Chondromyces apiculatus]|uniref:GCN5-related N-acetyltransferase n=1 Tax=Chondromyces apiculatus DSM 436 TaxID=1192034 RepID=A0A017T8W4_9BACT|nr:N-acetyltransferase [Chondromyces apiculatus]EYF05402.1 GCN5-related N-acetyltransferase [Chondromyces apiculatus DSM 436]
MILRDEHPGDEAAIFSLVTSAFAEAAHSSHTEPFIVDALRASGALSISLVAVEDGEIAGHVAFSEVAIDRERCGWFGLGPVAVHPTWQRRGIGRALIQEGLARLEAQGAEGCVVLGDPAYYGRFGFAADGRLTFAGAPAVYFQALSFRGAVRHGAVTYHAAFEADGPPDAAP